MRFSFAFSGFDERNRDLDEAAARRTLARARGSAF